MGALIWIKEEQRKTPAEVLDAETRIPGLIRDDDAFRFEIEAGKTQFIIGLPQNTATNRFSVALEKAEGTIRIYGSSTKLDADNKGWQPLSAATPLVPGVPFAVDWAWADVHYVKIEFDLGKGGNLAPFCLFGAPTMKDVKVVPVAHKGDVLPATTQNAANHGEPTLTTKQVNVAHAAANGRVTHVSSGLDRPQAAVNMIDEDVNTSYVFDAADERPTMLIALDNLRSICRVTAFYQAPPGAWDVYPLNHNPDDTNGVDPAKKKTAPSTARSAAGHEIPFAATPGGMMSFLTKLLLGQTPKVLEMPADFFEDHSAAFRITSKPGEPYGAVDFPTKSARFVLMRWVPSGPSNGQPIRVYQVSVFTDPQREWYDALPTTDFATLTDPDTGNAKGLTPPTQPITPPIPVDPPHPFVVSP